MRIAELPSIPQNPKQADVIAISADGNSYKVSLELLVKGLDLNIATVAETKEYLGIE